MKALDVNKEYIDLVLKDPELYLQDYKKTVEKVSNSKA